MVLLLNTLFKELLIDSNHHSHVQFVDRIGPGRYAHYSYNRSRLKELLSKDEVGLVKRTRRNSEVLV